MLEVRRHQLELGIGDVHRLESGLLITSPVRTVVDCASLLSFEALVSALDDALHRRVLRLGELDPAVGLRRGDPGAPALRRGVAAADHRAESPAETLARLLLLPVLPGLEPQVELFDAAARLVARFDLGDRVVRFAVEADGQRGHAGRQMVARDQRRDGRTAAYGWSTQRATWFELRREQAALRARMVRLHAEASRRA